MKNIFKISIITSTILSLNAEILTLNKQQIEDWKISSKRVITSKTIPLGSFMAEVVTPPQLLHSVTLPFASQLKVLKVAQYDYIKKGETLAIVTGSEWIKIQQKFIEDAIELKHHKNIAERKNRLCQEEIIPRKECIGADAEYKADKIRFASAKALLRGYGASNRRINELINKFKIEQSIPIKSHTSGKILKLNVKVGETIEPTKAFFIIQGNGALWLEVDIPLKIARRLKDKQKVTINFGEKKFKSRVILHSPQINIQNQTQEIRFSLLKTLPFLTGQKEIATISISKKSLKVPKKAVISLDNLDSVFIKKDKGYTPTSIKILGENREFYFVEVKDSLNAPIVVESVAILKSMMKGEDSE